MRKTIFKIINAAVNAMTSTMERLCLGNNGFIIISNNCWGYEIYNATRRQYNTPFVGLFLYPECYIKLISSFDKNINSELTFTKSSKYNPDDNTYPIGILAGDIEIHFLHYSSEQEAYSKWKRRKSRLLAEIKKETPLFFKFCDRDGCTNNHLQAFHNLPLENKFSIGIENFNSSNHFQVSSLKDKNNNSVIDGVQLYKKRYHYFDLCQWLIRGNARKTLKSRFLSLIT